MKGMNDMKLKYYGYKEAKVETRAMSIAELKLIINPASDRIILKGRRLYE